MRTAALIKAQDKYHKSDKFKQSHYQNIKRNTSLWNIILKEKGMNICQICGYDKHFSVIEFHHIDPKIKKYQFNNMYRLIPTSERIVELDKCVALCANCHRLIHNKVISIYKDELGWHRR